MPRFGLVLLAWLCGVAPAAAHLGHVVTRAERYLKIDAEPHGIRVVVSLTLGPEETFRILTDADTNEDGTVSDDEASVYMASWGEGLREDLPLEVDGERVEVLWGDAYLDPPGEVRAVPGAVEMVARISLDGGEHRIVLRDGMRRETFDRTDVAFTAQPGGEVLRAGAGPNPPEAATHLAFDAGTEVTPETFVVELRAAGMSMATKLALGGGALVALLAALGAWLALRRKKNAPTSAT